MMDMWLFSESKLRTKFDTIPKCNGISSSYKKMHINKTIFIFLCFKKKPRTRNVPNARKNIGMHIIFTESLNEMLIEYHKLMMPIKINFLGFRIMNKVRGIMQQF